MPDPEPIDVAALRRLTPEQLASDFHHNYETLAPHYGYRTRPETAVSWDEVPAANKALMIAVIRALVFEGLNLPAILDALEEREKLREEVAAIFHWNAERSVVEEFEGSRDLDPVVWPAITTAVRVRECDHEFGALGAVSGDSCIHCGATLTEVRAAAPAGRVTVAEERFEDRHRALRETLAIETRSLGLSDEHIAAVEAVDAFRERTGPLVDDLVAAVRRDFEHYDHPDGSADWLSQGLELRRATRAALAALDEAARG